LAIAAELGLPEDEMRHLRAAAVLHDLGKLRISRRTLRQLGSLTEEEISIMRRHSEVAMQILERIEELREAMPAIKCHCERYDGQGPLGLAGQAIPLGARIISVAEAYDILTSDVPWRDAMTHEEAMEELHRCSGTQFDPVVLAAFERSSARVIREAA